MSNCLMPLLPAWLCFQSSTALTFLTLPRSRITRPDVIEGCRPVAVSPSMAAAQSSPVEGMLQVEGGAQIAVPWCPAAHAMHRNCGTKYATRAAPRGKGRDGTRRKCYAPGHRATKFGKSSPGQCALSSGSSQHVGQSLPLLQPKGSHHVLERLSHSQQWPVLSQYAPSLQSEWESQVAGVIVELPVPAPKTVCMEEQKSATSSV